MPAAYYLGLLLPPENIETIAPSDNTALSHVARAINVATDGYVAIVTPNGSEAIVFVAAGSWFGISAAKVKATGTTATGITVGW